MDSPGLPLSDEALLEHAAWVRKVARELVRDPGTADDLAQETWLAFLRARPDPDRPLRPWFRTTLRNALSLRARRRSAQTWREADVARPESLPSSAELLIKAEEQHRLARLVLDLDEPYRTTLLLRYSEGLTPSQIAHARDVPASTVRSHIHRGLAALREQLDAEHGGDRRAWIVAFQPWALRREAASSLSASTVGLTLVVAVLAIWFGVAWAGGGGGPRRARDVDRVAVADGDASSTPAAVHDGAGASRVAAGHPVERVLTLVDVRTLRPLVAYAVRVGDHTIRSDDKGRLRVAANASQLTPIDAPGLATRSPVSHTRTIERPVERRPVAIPEDGIVPLHAGPTFRLDLSRAAIAAPNVLRATLAGDRENRPRQVATIRVAGGGFKGPWVRFGAVPEGAVPEGAATERVEAGVSAWRLEVRDEAGLLAGEAVLRDVLPEEPPLVRIDLGVTGAIKGRIAGITQDDAVILTTGALGSSIVAATAPNVDGRYALRWIAPGTYTMSVVSADRAAWTREIVVHAGETQIVDLSLDALPADDPDRGPVSGVVRSDSGTYSAQLLVFLLDAAGDTIDVYPTTWKPALGERALEARFEFPAAPAGGLTLDVVALANLVTASVSPNTFEAPREGIEITLRDRLPALDWRVDVVDDQELAVIERFDLDVRIDGGAPRVFRREPGEDDGARWTLIAGGLRWNTFEGPTPLRDLATDARVSWSVSAEGFVTVQGDASAFGKDPLGRRAVELRLRRKRSH